MVLIISLLIVGWVAAAVLGSQAYFRGEQTKPIHNRNWNNDSFEKLSETVTGAKIDYSKRVPAYAMDAYTSTTLTR